MSQPPPEMLLFVCWQLGSPRHPGPFILGFMVSMCIRYRYGVLRSSTPVYATMYLWCQLLNLRSVRRRNRQKLVKSRHHFWIKLVGYRGAWCVPATLSYGLLTAGFPELMILRFPSNIAEQASVGLTFGGFKDRFSPCSG